jgi:Bacterial Ig domain
MDRSRKGWLALGGVLLSLTLVATACAKKSDPGSGSGGATLTIASPADGTSVSEPFTLTVNASVPLGAPSTGDDHVHLCFDGASCDSEYTLVYGNTFQVANLSAGSHTIEASLRNADHTAAGPTATITVTVTGGASGGSGTTTPTASPSGAYGGYSYTSK